MVTVVTPLKTVIWHDQGSETVRQRLRDADEARAMIQEVGSRGGSKGKGKVLPYSLPSVGPGDDPGVQAVSPQVTISHPPGGRLPLLSARPAFYLRKRSPDGASTICSGEHLIAAHYSFIDPERMKG